MPLDAWITLGVVGLVFLALIRQWAAPDLLFLGATAIFALLGIISPQQAFSGFSNSQVLLVGLLFVISAGLRETGVLEFIGNRLLTPAQSQRSVLSRLALFVAPLSGFLNNTPVVAMSIPVVLSWCRRNFTSPSKVLIPLSYISILGGTCTLIGTSTNLVVNGLIKESGLPLLGLFTITPLGVIYTIVGTLFLIIFSDRLLPLRHELMEKVHEDNPREYRAEMVVQRHCSWAGKTINSIPFLQQPSVVLEKVYRGNKTIEVTRKSTERIRRSDRLVFRGILNAMVELQNVFGLTPEEHSEIRPVDMNAKDTQLYEVVLSKSSPLVGQILSASDFYAAYKAQVIGIHRGGMELTERIGEIRLQAGDTFLLAARPGFLRLFRNDSAFYLISEVPEWRPLRLQRAWLAGSLFLALVISMSTTPISSAVVAALVAVGMILSGCLSANDARRSVDGQVLVTIASSFGVGIALRESGAALALTQLTFSHVEALGPWFGVAAIYLIGSLMTELITNNAVAVLMFPFCLEAAKLYDSDPLPFLIALIFSASASFLTPFGYQTNLMVYGPGGYRVSDFLRIGLPLNLLLAVVGIVMIPIIWPF